MGHTNPYTNDHHKYIGRSNMGITFLTIMVTQYKKIRHMKSKGVMATNGQGGSMLKK